MRMKKTFKEEDSLVNELTNSIRSVRASGNHTSYDSDSNTNSLI
jgi:hypothetical protein